MAAEEQPLRWEGYEHQHIERGADWFWALGIISITTALIVLLFGNFLFSVLILIAGATIGLLASKQPPIATFEITGRGLVIDDRLYPYDIMEAFWIEYETPAGPTLLLDTRRVFAPHLVIPIAETIDTDAVREHFIQNGVPETELQEPLSHRLLEFLGF